MTTELDNSTLEWAAQWLVGSLKGESNERVKEFAGNMAMTLRAAKTDSRVPAGGVVTKSALDEIEAALISIADGVSPQIAVGQAFNVINSERLKLNAATASPAETN